MDKDVAAKEAEEEEEAAAKPADNHEAVNEPRAAPAATADEQEDEGE